LSWLLWLEGKVWFQILPLFLFLNCPDYFGWNHGHILPFFIVILWSKKQRILAQVHCILLNINWIADIVFIFQDSCSLFCNLYKSWCHSPIATVSLSVVFIFQDSCSLFCNLYKSWCHSPIATVSLCCFYFSGQLFTVL
jgi:hypothetical protein